MNALYTAGMDYSPLVLKNKGVPVQIATLREEDGKWVPVYDAEGKQETEEFYVRFTHNSIADIEELWDGLPNWQEQMEEKPVSSMRRTFSLLLSESTEKVGLRMLEGRLTDYSGAIGVAWAIANGVDPTTASRLLKQAEAAADSQMTVLNDELVKSLDEMEAEEMEAEAKTD